MQLPCVITERTKTKKTSNDGGIPLSVIELRYFRAGGAAIFRIARKRRAPTWNLSMGEARVRKGSPWMDRSRPWNRREVTSAKSCGFSKVSPKKSLSLSLSLFFPLAVFLLLNGSRKLKAVHTPIEFSFRQGFSWKDEDRIDSMFTGDVHPIT